MVFNLVHSCHSEASLFSLADCAESVNYLWSPFGVGFQRWYSMWFLQTRCWKPGSPFFSSVALALEFGSHVCKGVLVWSILLSGRMWWMGVEDIERKRPCWGFSTDLFLALLCIVYGELEMKLCFMVIQNLRSRFSNWFFGQLEPESPVKASSRRPGKMLEFISPRI